MIGDYFIWRNGVRYFHLVEGHERVAVMQRRNKGDRDEAPAPPRTVNNPYYIGNAQMVGAREQGRDKGYAPKFAKATLQEAVNEATRRLAADSKLTEVSIVRIVRVVRRAAPVPPPPAVTIEVVE